VGSSPVRMDSWPGRESTRNQRRGVPACDRPWRRMSTGRQRSWAQSCAISVGRVSTEFVGVACSAGVASLGCGVPGSGVERVSAVRALRGQGVLRSIRSQRSAGGALANSGSPRLSAEAAQPVSGV
jgi:hypothetical protein